MAKAIISALLLVAIFIPLLTVPNANSQSGAATTIVKVNTPPPHQCVLVPLAVSAQKGQLLQGAFTADVILDFYVLTETDFSSSAQWTNCALPQTAHPLYKLLQVFGSNNAYSVTLPTSGTYYALFIYRNNGLTQIASGYATINLTYLQFMTLTRVNTTATPYSSSNSTTLSVNTTTTSDRMSSRTSNTNKMPTS